MEWVNVLGVSAVSAGVSALVTIGFRAWDAKKVKWVITGVRYAAANRAGDGQVIKSEIHVHNVGDGDAINVMTWRKNDEAYGHFKELEMPILKGGETFVFTMQSTHAHQDDAQFQIHWESSPLRGGKQNQYGPILLKDHLIHYTSTHGTSRQEIDGLKRYVRVDASARHPRLYESLRARIQSLWRKFRK